ncbi:MAG TPA: aldehyde dehydrogenase family protein [Chitinophagales bacterium]|nr:MAG: aldehyde dehydrogenase family protein [Bacteroidetes bacterium 37-13]HRP39363.1 aldehyde dehydrogenase family protein [Chitinophagales bacterium]
MSTASLTQQVPISTNTKLDEILNLFDAQFKNKANIRSTTAKERISKLRKLRNLVIEKRSEIAKAIYDDFRKPEVEAEYSEIVPVVVQLNHAIRNLSDWMKPEEVDTPLIFFGSSSKVVFEPKGNTLIITPWNYPFQLSLCAVISAVAAGNTVILKPSEFTPNTSAYLKKILAEVFPENEVAVVQGDYTVSNELLKIKFDHIHFTGSPAVGKIIMRAASEFLTPVTLELGGKSPAIIDETANVKAAAMKLTWGKFLNKGQTCIAPDYVLIHESKHDEFIAKMRERIEQNFGSDPQKSADLGRMVNAKHYGRVKELLEDAVNNGAKVEAGGKVAEGENYISPTVLSNVPLKSKIMQEEIFGPLLPVIKYKTIDEALAYVNAGEKPLALYIFSDKSKNQNDILNRTTAGGTVINDNIVHVTQPYLPFGGVNNSGIGKSMGHYGFKEFSNERAVVKQLHSGSSMQLLYPPYKGYHKKLIDFMLKWLV